MEKVCMQLQVSSCPLNTRPKMVMAMRVFFETNFSQPAWHVFVDRKCRVIRELGGAILEYNEKLANTLFACHRHYHEHYHFGPRMTGAMRAQWNAKKKRCTMITFSFCSCYRCCCCYPPDTRTITLSVGFV